MIRIVRHRGGKSIMFWGAFKDCLDWDHLLHRRYNGQTHIQFNSGKSNVTFCR